jgi:hypothetical protein
MAYTSLVVMVMIAIALAFAFMITAAPAAEGMYAAGPGALVPDVVPQQLLPKHPEVMYDGTITPRIGTQRVMMNTASGEERMVVV